MLLPTENPTQNAILEGFLEGDMGRRRLQQKGELRKIGGWWRGRWHEDQIQPDGSVKYGWSRFRDVGPAAGENRMTRKEAERSFWENYLSRLDENMRTPQSILTVAQFVERRFIPENVMVKMKASGIGHYTTMLPFVLGGIPVERRSFKGTKKGQELPEIPRVLGIGGKRMRDVTHEDIQRLISEALRRKYSVQTARHIKTCVSAIYTFAEEIRWFSGRNPAKFVRLPEMTRKAVRVLSFDELKALLAILKPQARAMVLCASMTSMNIAEVCGLRWKRVNLTDEPIIVDGESLPAHSTAVREQWYKAAFGTVKAKSRRRNLPLPKLLVEALKDLYAGVGVDGDTRQSSNAGRTGTRPGGDEHPQAVWDGDLPKTISQTWVDPVAIAGREGTCPVSSRKLTSGASCSSAGSEPARQLPTPDDPVFAGREGKPRDQSAMLKRQVKPAAAKIGAPTLGWHDLRRTFATLADQLGMSMGERQALMGHARAAQTMAYTHTPTAQTLAALEKFGRKVSNVVEIKKRKKAG